MTMTKQPVTESTESTESTEITEKAESGRRKTYHVCPEIREFHEPWWDDIEDIPKPQQKPGKLSIQRG